MMQARRRILRGDRSVSGVMASEAKRRRILTAILWVVGVLTLGGLAIAADIVRREGWEGFWKRKRDAVEALHPQSQPVIEEFERVRSRGR